MAAGIPWYSGVFEVMYISQATPRSPLVEEDFTHFIVMPAAGKQEYITANFKCPSGTLSLVVAVEDPTQTPTLEQTERITLGFEGYLLAWLPRTNVLRAYRSFNCYARAV